MQARQEHNQSREAGQQIRRWREITEKWKMTGNKNNNMVLGEDKSTSQDYQLSFPLIVICFHERLFL